MVLCVLRKLKTPFLNSKVLLALNICEGFSGVSSNDLGFNQNSRSMGPKTAGSQRQRILSQPSRRAQDALPLTQAIQWSPPEFTLRDRKNQILQMLLSAYGFCFNTLILF